MEDKSQTAILPRSQRTRHSHGLEHQHQYALPWPAIECITPKKGCAAATLHEWVKRHQIDFGKRDGINTDERERIKKLEQENKELRRANEILKLASAFLPKRRKAANSNKLSRLKKLSIIATESSQFTTSCRLALQTIGIMLLDVCNQHYVAHALNAMSACRLTYNV